MRNVFHYLQDFKLRHLHTGPGIEEHQDDSAVPDATGSDASVARRTVLTKIGDRQYLIASDDDYLNHIEGIFEPDMTRLFDVLIRPDHTVFDVGANVGCTSILFGSKARHVYSFEPSPSTYAYLEENIRSANLKNVTPINTALGKENGTSELVFSSNNRSGAFVSMRVTASDGHQVETIRVMKGDDFVKARDIAHVDFIKIDVEGFEKHVIEGLAETISRDKPAVVLELNHWCLNVFQRTSVPEFLDFLRGLFPYLYAVEKNDIKNLHDRNEAYHVMYHHIVSGFQYANLIGAFKKEQLLPLAKAFEFRID